MEENTQIEECLNQLVNDDLRLKRIVGDLQKRVHSNETLENLEREARSSLAAMRTRLSELDSLTAEEESEVRKAEFLRAMHNYSNQLQQSQALYRRGIFEARRRLAQSEKKHLLEGSGENQQNQTRQRKMENAATMSTQLTQDMLSLSRLLAAQTDRSSETMGHLVRSSGQINRTEEEFKMMSGHISTASRLLNKFGRRETTDRILMFFAFLFFFVTCGYIVVKRIF